MSVSEVNIRNVLSQMQLYQEQLWQEIDSYSKDNCDKKNSVKRIKKDILDGVIRKVESELLEEQIPNQEKINEMINLSCHETVRRAYHEFLSPDRIVFIWHLNSAGYPMFKGVPDDYKNDDRHVIWARSILFAGGFDMGFFHVKEPRAKKLVNQLFQAAPNEIDRGNSIKGAT